ncbi:MAG: tRNA (adenosine(37)-N6)-threonylcarbamoyltransferase complex dimerization subunit type 1 TsaB [Bacillota bacterium]
MIILALDTSSIVASVALMEDEKLLGEYTINHKRTHSQKLMPMIDQLLQGCELTMQDVDLIGVAEGPGSFTGLRIGVATAKGLAHAVDIPVVGVSTLDALAFNLPYCEGLVCPILDARRSQVYTGVYKWEAGMLHRILTPQTMTIEELIGELSKRPERVVFLGDGIEVNREKLEASLKGRVILAPNRAKMPSAASVAELALQKAQNKELMTYYELTPEYLRKSEAERQYEDRVKRVGLDGNQKDDSQ